VGTPRALAPAVLGLALAGALVANGLSGRERPPEEAGAPPPPAPPPARPASVVPWVDSLSEGLRLARERGVLCLVHVHAPADG
jgi:hypothetical protein